MAIDVGTDRRLKPYWKTLEAVPAARQIKAEKDALDASDGQALLQTWRQMGKSLAERGAKTKRTD